MSLFYFPQITQIFADNVIKPFDLRNLRELYLPKVMKMPYFTRTTV